MQPYSSGLTALTPARSKGSAASSRTATRTKATLWPRPNYRRLVREGHAPAKVRLLAFLYDWVPSKPRASLPHAQEYYESAVQRFAAAAFDWLRSASHYPALSVSDFSDVLARVMGLAWGGSPTDPAYFTARFERTVRGCEIHVLVGADSPFKRVPSVKAFEAMRRQLALGWPAARPPYERKRVFVVERSSLTVDGTGGLVRYRWPLSAASDRGYLCCFTEADEAREWMESLPPYLVITDRTATRLVSTHDDPDEAQRCALACAADVR